MNKYILLLLCIFPLLAFSYEMNFKLESSYDRVINILDNLSKVNPLKTQRFSLGFNDHNTLIEGIKVGDISNKDAKHFIIIGAHHGNETKSVDLALEFARLKLSQNIVNKVFHIIPVLNIDGYNAGRRYEKDKYGQLVDPNRDYPDVCDANKANFELQSTYLLSSYIKDYPFIGSITIHGYIGTFTFPWGMYTDQSETLDDNLYNKWAMLATKENNYQYGTHKDVIYPAVGTYEDWVYYEYGIWSVLVEMDRYASLSKDAMAMDVFFSQLPANVSQNNQHIGNCDRKLNSKYLNYSRP